MRCNHHHHHNRHPHHFYPMSPEVLLKSDGHFKGQNPTNIFSNPSGKSCRYNIHGFVEELPKLPENRFGHACAALPSTEVRPTQSTFCRRLLLLEDMGTDTADFHLFTLFSTTPQNGHPSPPFQEHWVILELQLWEARSGWSAVKMNKVPPDLR